MHLPEEEASPDERHLAAIEQAMVAIRRGQRSRRLARLTRRAPGADVPEVPGTPPPAAAAAAAGTAVFEVVDVVEAAEQAGEEATVSTVAAELDVAQPRASKLVAAAVAAGLLRREADQADGRRTVLVRTGAGRALSDHVHRFRRRIFAASMAGWSEHDRATFARLLARFAAGMDQAVRQQDGGAD